MRNYILGSAILLILISIILIIVSVATNTWITQPFAFNDGTGATGTFVIGPLRFCANLNPNPFYQSACGLIDAQCFTDVGNVVAAFFPACAQFNLFRIFLALTLGFIIISALFYVILIFLPTPRIHITCIIFSTISWICGMIVMAVFVSYRTKLAGTWTFGGSFAMSVVVWLFMLLTMVCGLLLHYVYPASPMGSYDASEKQTAKERKKQQQMMEKEQQEADKRERARAKSEKKSKDTDSTEMVAPPIAPPMAPSMAPPMDPSPTHSHHETPTYSPAPGEEPSQSTSHLPLYSQNHSHAIPPPAISTPRGSAKQTKFPIPPLPAVIINHPAPMAHFSSNPALSPLPVDPTSTYEPAIIAPVISPSPINTDRSDKDNPKKDKKKKKDVLEDDPSDAAEWWLAHNNEIVARQTVFRAGSMVSTTSTSPLMTSTRPPASSQYSQHEEYRTSQIHSIPGMAERGSQIYTIPGIMRPSMITQSTPSTIAPFRLPPRGADMVHGTNAPPAPPMDEPYEEQQQLYENHGYRQSSSGYGTPRGVTWAATSTPETTYSYAAYQYPPPPQ